MAHQYIFQMYRLSKVYPPDKTVLSDITLAFLPGAKIGVLGRNGSARGLGLHAPRRDGPVKREGDGRAVLRSTIREYLCSEAMHGLGVPTSRALCLVGSDHQVYREQVETGAMLVRMAPSHVRFGTFEIFYYRKQHEQLKILADYVIALEPLRRST